jgi:hypothetical protein
VERRDRENPEPTETERELEGTERHQAEEDMRGGAQDDDLPIEDDEDNVG